MRYAISMTVWRLVEKYSFWPGPCAELEEVRKLTSNVQDRILAVFNAIEVEEESDGFEQLR